MWWHCSTSLYTSANIVETLEQVHADWVKDKTPFLEPHELAYARVVDFVKYLKSEVCTPFSSIVIFSHGFFLYRLSGMLLPNCGTSTVTNCVKNFTRPHDLDKLYWNNCYQQ
eukprot:TRINITY_DN2447_c0_g1_i2.p3 TRINITY_DN2447_c0_g1~~TRINITY_DN2447_c0_g1_i2.p3  ORF type:complete len:112 (-),score=28.19 TRINITY_DN2447_c0_g1_i2:44-379(-)